jgi:hypothetical protein
MYIGKLAEFDKDKTIISLKESSLKCQSCGGNCHELLNVPKPLIFHGEIGNFAVIRCINCIFWGPYFVYFKDGKAIRVQTPKNYECHNFIEDQCEPDSVASIDWIASSKAKNLGYTPTFAGGKPEWLQKSEWPKCPECGKKMEFILQLSSDSIDTLLRNKNFKDKFTIEIEYYATLYFFFCEKCDVSCSITQCT